MGPGQRGPQRNLQQRRDLAKRQPGKVPQEDDLAIQRAQRVQGGVDALATLAALESSAGPVWETANRARPSRCASSSGRVGCRRRWRRA